MRIDTPELDELYVGHVADLETRYAAIFQRQGWDTVVVHGGSPVARSEFDDQFWALRPLPHFQHWVPLVEPDATIILRPGLRPTLIRTLRSPKEAFWEKPAAPESEAFFDLFDGITTESHASVKSLLGSGRVAVIAEKRSSVAGWAVDPDSLNPPELVRDLDQLRVTKTPYEIACIAEANRRAAPGHAALGRIFLEGDASELDLHLSYLSATGQDDGETPYKNIVALGANAATLHHVAYGRRADRRSAESLLVDAGATCRGYASDITRTWSKGAGAAASHFAQLVAGIDAMQKRLCGTLRIGLDYEDLHEESHRQVAGLLRDVGLATGSVEELVETGVTRAFYPHGLGHSLGLQTHDVGCALRKPRAKNPFLRNTRDIAAGQVFTIEPGVYFIDALLEPLRTGATRTLVDWDMVRALAPLGGVRVEDDVAALPDEGFANLTRREVP